MSEHGWELSSIPLHKSSLEDPMREHEVGSIDPRLLGRRIQGARKARGLTQQEVADALSVARTTVYWPWRRVNGGFALTR